MILDSSVIVAILSRERGWEALVRRLAQAPMVAVGAPTLVEVAMVLSSRMQRDAWPLIHEFLREASVEVAPFAREHYEAAVDAFQRYGKGRHPAALNFGDCLVYALVRLSGLPLLYTGDDFSRTDIGAR